jgi:hypothetical protein
MSGAQATAIAAAPRIGRERTDDSMQRLQGWIAALEADRLRLTRTNEEQTARDRLCDQRYLEFVREVLR